MKQCSIKAPVGIIGDGQLALMLAESLNRMGKPFLCLSSSVDSPMLTFFPDHITQDADFFRETCGVFTLENEFHTIPELENLLKEKKSALFPTIESYSFFADKISQREFYESAGITSPKWMALKNPSDLEEVPEKFPYPFVLKMSKGGYDGKGVRIISNNEEFITALDQFNFFKGNHLLVEEKVQIVKEVAQGFLKDKNGQFTLLPLVDTIQENGVCNLVQYPSTVSPNTQAQIEFFLERLIEKNLIGIFNFEFFIDQHNRVIINEGAPRTHNSQHLTMNASQFSQFDLLALYLTDSSRTPRKMTALPSVMINILGQTNGSYGDLKLPEVDSLKVHSKLYGKSKSSPGRKMGHVNVIDEEGRSDLLAIGRKILKEYRL